MHMMLFARFTAAASLLAGLLLASNASATIAASPMRDSNSIELSSQNKPTSAVIKKKPMQKKIGTRDKKIGVRANRPSPKLNPQPEPPSRPAGMR